VYHDFQHSYIDVEFCDSSRTVGVSGALSVTQTAWRPYSMLQTVQRVTASACAYFGTGWTEKQYDSQIDEAKKNYL
jgi:hypothetical protein